MTQTLSAPDFDYYPVTRALSGVRIADGDVEVRWDDGSASNAFTSVSLPVHNDLCTREYVPGLQFLFCLHNSCEGGDSLFVDAYSVAEQLRAESPESFEVLATVAVPFGHPQSRFRSPLLRPGTGARRRGGGDIGPLHVVAAQPHDRRRGDDQEILRCLQALPAPGERPRQSASHAAAPGEIWPASTTGACCTAAPPSTPPPAAAGCAAATASGRSSSPGCGCWRGRSGPAWSSTAPGPKRRRSPDMGAR